MPLTLATTTPGEAEIFASIQGEGPSAGRPCAFVRLSRCNLACQWCDTAYTWRFDGDNRPHRDGLAFQRSANQVVLDEAEVAGRINALGLDRLVITGGEPLLQGAQLARMVAMLDGISVEIETNGSVPVHPALAPQVAQFNVSPKLAHSGNDAALALDPERLFAWASEPKANFKFVIAEPSDLDEVLAIQKAHGITGSRIRLMPEGTTSDIIRACSAWLAPLALDHGLGFSDRLHIHLYGDTRGT